MRKKVYSYIRFSDPKQAKGHSSERQMTYAMKYAEENNMSLDESLTMKDEGLSAYHQTHIKRGAFGVFLSAVESGKVSGGSVLIVEALDRISRAEPIEAQAILSQIIMAGITVITASDGKMYERDTIRKNPMDLVYSLLIFVRANEESETKSRRVKKSIVKQIKHWIDHGNGKIIRNGRDPYWCQPREDKSGFDLIPERVDIVKDIISVYRKGWGFNKIVKYLNNNYKPFKGKRWYVQYITTFIRNRVLIGERSFKVNDKEYIIPNYYPAILTSDEFSDLQYEIKQRASTKSQRKYPSIITGMRTSYCGICGEPIISQNYTHRELNGRLADGFRRVRCNSENNGHKCLNSKSISVAPIEKCILEYCLDSSEISKMLGDNDKTAKLRALLSGKRARIDEINISLESAEKSIVDLLSKGEKVSQVINGIVDKLKVENDSVMAEILKLEDEIDFHSRHQSPDMLEEWSQIKLKAQNLDEETRLMLRQMIKRTFNRITVFLHGMQSSDNPAINLVKDSLGTNDNTIDLILTFHNNKTRILSIDKKTGSWVKGGDVSISDPSVLQGLAEHQTSVTEEPV